MTTAVFLIVIGAGLCISICAYKLVLFLDDWTFERKLGNKRREKKQ